jgi:phosphonoacetaldehyde hydrolase
MAVPRVTQAWTKHHGHAPTEVDTDAFYAAFVPKNTSVAARHANLIPGAADVVAELRSKGIKIGSTTGSTPEIMAEILPVAAAQGFKPDSLVCTGDTPEGRLTPVMLYKTLLALVVWPAWSVIKVDDTGVGIAEGINEGAWTVGVSVSGNCFGMLREEASVLAPPDCHERRKAALKKLEEAGSHYVIDSVADLMPIVLKIEARPAQGERP